MNPYQKLYDEGYVAGLAVAAHAVDALMLERARERKQPATDAECAIAIRALLRAAQQADLKIQRRK